MEQGIMITTRSIPEITADIRINQRQAAVSIAAIGADLIDAKEKLSHGEWLPWLASIDMAASTADNYMRYAREARGSELLASLPYSKALALLALPEADRASFVVTHEIDTKSAAEIKRLIAEVKKEKDARLQDADKLGKLAAAERAKREAAEAQAEALRQQMRERPERIIEKPVEPPDYKAAKNQVQELRDRLAEAEAAACEAEERAAEAADETQQLRRQLADIGAGEPIGGPDGLSLSELLHVCNEFTGKVWMVPYMADYFREASPEERRGYRLIVEGIQTWAGRVLDAIQQSTEPIVLPEVV